MDKKQYPPHLRPTHEPFQVGDVIVRRGYPVKVTGYTKGAFLEYTIEYFGFINQRVNTCKAQNNVFVFHKNDILPRKVPKGAVKQALNELRRQGRSWGSVHGRTVARDTLAEHGINRQESVIRREVQLSRRRARQQEEKEEVDGAPPAQRPRVTEEGISKGTEEGVSMAATKEESASSGFWNKCSQYWSNLWKK